MPTVTRWIAPLLVTAALVGGAWALAMAAVYGVFALGFLAVLFGPSPVDG